MVERREKPVSLPEARKGTVFEESPIVEPRPTFEQITQGTHARLFPLAPIVPPVAGFISGALVGDKVDTKSWWGDLFLQIGYASVLGLFGALVMASVVPQALAISIGVLTAFFCLCGSMLTYRASRRSRSLKK